MATVEVIQDRKITEIENNDVTKIGTTTFPDGQKIFEICINNVRVTLSREETSYLYKEINLMGMSDSIGFDDEDEDCLP